MRRIKLLWATRIGEDWPPQLARRIATLDRILGLERAHWAKLLGVLGDDRIRDIRFDAMLVAPGRIPRHIPAAFDASVPIPKFANPRGTL